MRRPWGLSLYRFLGLKCPIPWSILSVVSLNNFVWCGEVNSTVTRRSSNGNLKLDKQYKKDANEAKIYIDGIKARQTTRRTLTPSYVFNVCTTSHICKWDRDPNVRPPALCRVYKATDSRSVISFIKTMADLSDTDTDVEELIDGAEESSENVNGHRTVNNEKYERIQLLLR